MRRLFLLPLLLLLACNPERTTNVVEKPADLIPEEKMVQVLTDVHLLEASLGIRAGQAMQVRNRLPGMPVDSMISLPEMKKDPLPYYDIFQKHGVTHQQYEASIHWYTSQPEIISRIYDDVIIELTKRQAHDKPVNPAPAPPPNPAQDSAPHAHTILPSGQIKK